MRRKHAFGPLLATSLVLASTSTLADEIILENGDRITGTVIGKEGDTLKIDTPYAGTVEVKWSQVTRIATDKPVRIILDDDSRVNGTLLEAPDGNLRLRSDDSIEGGPIPLAKVTYINPPPEVDGGVISTGKLNLGINISKGNTDTEDAHFDGEVVARTLKNRFTLGAIFNRSRSYGVDTKNDATGYAKYDHFLEEKWYAYANALFFRDKFKDIRMRTTLGLGSGYQFVTSPRKNLSLEGGLNYVNEDYYTAEDNAYPSARWSLNYDQYIGQTEMQFFHFHEGYIGLTDAEDFFLRTQTGVRVPLWEALKATFQFDFDWDNTPSPGTQEDDTRYLISIGYHW